MPLPVPPALPPPSAEAAAHSRRVANHIAAQVAAAGGWIPFSRYMELALYAPGLGYYAAGARKFGAGGDFVTAPEISHVFGQCLARQAAEVLDATGGDILELGPGSGALAASMYRELRAMERAPQRYRLLEVSPDLQERQRTHLAQEFPGDADRFEWADTLPADFRGLVIANEVLDVVPFSIVRRSDDRYFERGVVAEGDGFAWQDRELGDGDLLRRARAVFPPGGYEYESEISLPAEALVRTVAQSLRAGIALLIDYGFAQPELYHPQRSMGTLRCHYRHHFHGDPFFLPGLQDITAHVDFTAMAQAAESAGADVYGYATQASFLIAAGLTDFLSRIEPELTVERMKATSAAHRLVSPAEMGELFKVLAIGRGIEAPLVGFESARPLAL
jgi:SAM-dependent MidA family methyltransferase